MDRADESAYRKADSGNLAADTPAMDSDTF
jgi:hypothetical protein